MTYNRKNPFIAAIKERWLLCDGGKRTYHAVLDIAGSGLRYAPGDCVAILPDNPPEIVEATLEALGASGEELVLPKRAKQSLPLKQFLRSGANLQKPTKALLSLLGTSHGGEAWELLCKHRGVISPAQVALLLSPLLPRFYSIASAMTHVGHEIHLTVRHLDEGVCCRFLEEAPLNEPTVPIYPQASAHFALPEGDQPIILIGPGTGIAPYRGFLQERRARNLSKNWLFFGEWTREGHFFYRDFWEELEQQGLLRLSTAFSRDQEEKVYVQHRLWEEREELKRWLHEGAYLYVCGNASSMAPAVEEVLKSITSAETVRQLRRERRYRRDIY